MERIYSEQNENILRKFNLENLPSLNLKGEGIEEINDKIKNAEKKLDYMSNMNEYLLALADYDGKNIKEIKKTLLGVIYNCTPRGEIEEAAPFLKVLNEPVEEFESTTFNETFGYYKLSTLLKTPIFQPKQKDPHKIIEKLESLYNSFVVENNLIILYLSSLSHFPPKKLSGKAFVFPCEEPKVNF